MSIFNKDIIIHLISFIPFNTCIKLRILSKLWNTTISDNLGINTSWFTDGFDLSIELHKKYIPPNFIGKLKNIQNIRDFDGSANVDRIIVDVDWKEIAIKPRLPFNDKPEYKIVADVLDSFLDTLAIIIDRKRGFLRVTFTIPNEGKYFFEYNVRLDRILTNIVIEERTTHQEINFSEITLEGYKGNKYMGIRGYEQAEVTVVIDPSVASNNVINARTMFDTDDNSIVDIIIVPSGMHLIDGNNREFTDGVWYIDNSFNIVARYETGCWDEDIDPQDIDRTISYVSISHS